MTDRLRELAGKIDKATPGPWFVPKFGKGSYIVSRVKEVFADRPHFLHGGVDVLEARDSIRKKDREAICLARNECPAMLREAADEIERLRGIAKIMATAIWYRHDTPEATMTANEFLNDPTTKEAK